MPSLSTSGECLVYIIFHRGKEWEVKNGTKDGNGNPTSVREGSDTDYREEEVGRQSFWPGSLNSCHGQLCDKNVADISIINIQPLWMVESIEMDINVEKLRHSRVFQTAAATLERKCAALTDTRIPVLTPSVGSDIYLRWYHGIAGGWSQKNQFSTSSWLPRTWSTWTAQAKAAFHSN